MWAISSDWTPTMQQLACSSNDLKPSKLSPSSITLIDWLLTHILM